MWHLKVVTFAAAFVGFAIMAGAYELGFGRWPPQAILADGSTARFSTVEIQACFRAQIRALFGDSVAADDWRSCQDQLAEYGALDAFDLRSLAVVGGAVIGILALLGFALSIRADRSSSKVTRGSRLHLGPAGFKAFARASARECRIHGHGVELFPSIALSRDRETRHFLILGSVGGGKTQTMLHLIIEAIARDDGVLVLDTKGDMMAGLPAEGAPLLVAPHDRRSLVWDVASDCSIKQDARELAARFIPPSTDPMWSHAAQEIFVACIVHLQATRGRDWGWADLEAVVTADVDVLTEHARNHNPNALRLLNQPDSRTTLSILTTFQTHMRIVSVLAEAWPDPAAGRFSIRDWLHNPVPRRPLILQHDPGYPELSRIWIGSMLGLLASAVGSPTLAESRTRRVWLFLDEFPHLPADQAISDLPGAGPLQGHRCRHQRARHGANPGRLWAGPSQIVVRHDRH